MYESMLNDPNHRLFNRSKQQRSTPNRTTAMHQFALKPLQATLLIIGLIFLIPGSAADSKLPSKPQTQSEATQAVQAQVERRTSMAAADKRKHLLADATAALAETENALKALEDGRNEAALTALAAATGKLELIVARETKLALAPVRTEIVSYDLLADPSTVKSTIQVA